MEGSFFPLTLALSVSDVVFLVKVKIICEGEKRTYRENLLRMDFSFDHCFF